MDSLENVTRRDLDATLKLSSAPPESIALDAGLRPGEVRPNLARLRDACLVV